MAISQAQFDLAKADPKLANIVYHDWEAESYDDKWSISYDQRCVDYARNCFDHVVPRESQGSDLAGSRVVELGSGTGFFLLNLMQSGIGGSGIVTDLSSGMVSVAVRNGKNLGLDVTGLVADAELLPFVDSSVDLVVGHAVLHHVPDLDALFAEVNRVLRPGGRLMVLEFSQLPNPMMQKAYDLYSFNVIPRMGQMIANDRDSYQYLVESIRNFPDQDTFLGMVRAAGFENAKYRNLTLGVAALHSGWKI